MCKKIFSGHSIEECLKKGSKSLNLPEANLKYEVIEKSRGLFKKKVVIAIEKASESTNNLNGNIKICNNEIVVIDPKEGGNPALIKCSDKVKIFVDEQEITQDVKVFKENKIKFEMPKCEAKRELNINVTYDKMQAILNIKYKPKIRYKIKDTSYSKVLIPEIEVKEEKYPPLFTVEEIKQHLQQKNIVYGLIEESIYKCSKEKEVNNLIVAKGTLVVDDTEDKLDIKFNKKQEQIKIKSNDNIKIDYKNKGFVKSVSKGETLVLKIEGKKGNDGVNIYGKDIKRKQAKSINLEVGEGCEIKDNKVIATINGRPIVTNYKFDVREIQEVQGNVDMNTGNIKFIGDILISGNIMPDMKVESGGSIEISKNIEEAEIISKGNILIKKNAIASKISAGKEEVEKLKLIEELTLFKDSLNELVVACKQIKQYKLMGKEINDGQILKILMENKFKGIVKLCRNMLKSEFIEEQLKNLIKQKIIGIAPLSIRYYTEIYVIIEFIEKKIGVFSNTFILPSNVELAYCQECEIKSSGDVIISGKGEYISKINANNDIVFTNQASIVRGGILKAKNSIKCGIVGSKGGVSTKLEVQKDGNIWAKICYQNTVFVIGKRKKIMESSSKDVHVYLNKKGEIEIEKLKI